MGSHVPTWAPVNVTPWAPACAVGTPWMLIPSAEKTASDGPIGVVTIHAPTIGWLAMASGVVSWADTPRSWTARASPRPVAAMPDIAARRETDSLIREDVIGF